VLATFIIGLREGLEAALIVGIVAAFLRRNGRPLLPMWTGVLAAVALSLVVGVTLAAVEQSLPQAAQEGMESVIGAVAVVLVTGMILWMGTHARGLKGELEASAREALGGGTSRALVVMAFLAVLKEGFETSVFLLATFQASTNATTAATGAVLGLLAAVVLGAGIYGGGVRVDLARFFRATGIFLVLVAAGLVVTSLRTAHEAGWLNAGQGRTVDLAGLAPVGSVRGSLFTGVLGIPADIRLVEVTGWFCYLVPMLAVVLWPAARRPGPVAGVRLRQAVAGAAVLAAGLLAVLARPDPPSVPAAAPVVDAAGAPAGTASLSGSRLTVRTPGGTATYALSRSGDVTRGGTTAGHLTGAPPGGTAGLPATLTLDALVAANGGRVPVGIDARRDPGPYTARWSEVSDLDAWTAGGRLLDAAARRTLVLTLSGGGLPASRTLTVPAGAVLPGAAAPVPGGWTVDAAYVDRVSGAARTLAADRAEARFWGRAVPGVLLGVAAVLLLLARRRRRALSAVPGPGREAATTDVHTSRSNVHVG